MPPTPPCASPAALPAPNASSGCAHHFNFHAFATDLPTRSGTVVRGTSPPETTFLGPDAAPSAPAIAACAAFLDARPDGQVLAICGSLPRWADPAFDPLRAALERWLSRGTLVADTYGSPLAWFAERPLALIKINADEFRTLPGHAGPLPDALAATGSSATRWVISDGPRTVWFRERGGDVGQLVPPVVDEVSATGSGDVLLASILDSIFRQGLDLRAAVARAVPLAAANAAHPGIAEFP